MRLTLTRAPEAGWLVTDESGVPIGGFTDINDALIFMRSRLDPEAAAAAVEDVAAVEAVPPTGGGWPRLLRGGRS